MRSNHGDWAARLGMAGAIVAGIAAALHPLAADSGVLQAENKAQPPRRPPPLIVDEGEPLLLLEKSGMGDKPAPNPTDGPTADNHACFVCHTNYAKEPLARRHAAENIGCAKCHGESFAHRNDENNTTPPDVMIPHDAIDDMCQACHESHNAAAKDVIDRFQERCPEKTDPKSIVCTDCHGRHRLAIRTVRWDKKTGRLITGDRP